MKSFTMINKIFYRIIKSNIENPQQNFFFNYFNLET